MSFFRLHFIICNKIAGKRQNQIQFVSKEVANETKKKKNASKTNKVVWQVITSYIVSIVVFVVCGGLLLLTTKNVLIFARNIFVNYMHMSFFLTF